MGGRCWNTSGKVVEFPILLRNLVHFQPLFNVKLIHVLTLGDFPTRPNRITICARILMYSFEAEVIMGYEIHCHSLATC